MNSYTRREIVTMLGGAALAAGCGSDDLPSPCHISERIEAYYRGVQISAPPFHLPKVREQLRGLPDIIGEENTAEVARVEFYDRDTPSCVAALRRERPRLSDNRNYQYAAGFTDGSGNIYLALTDVLTELNFWPSQVPLPYFQHFPTTLEGGLAQIFGHELGHILYGGRLADDTVFSYWQRKGLLFDPWWKEPVENEKEFEEEFVEQYGFFLHYGWLLRTTLDHSPLFQEFLLPSWQRGEVDAQVVRGILTRPQFLTIDDESTEPRHNELVEGYVRFGYLLPTLALSLLYAPLKDRLQELYQRWQRNDLKMLEELGAG